ncbi:MAG TPA: LpqB family beta-propeller domain-containing protein [Candidatus Limnocylindrales bacterium]|nr:LpqB family beta-propeller domain-containing protein [Candidatus Limnocylindrales bacterium]
MTSERRFDQDLPDLLAQVAQAPAPGYRDLIVERTARTRQRPAWTFPERWLPMSAVTSRTATIPRLPLRIVAVAALLLIALVVGAVLIAGSQQRVPAPFGPADNGRVAYVAGGDIYTADPVTGAATALVTGPETDAHPVWSLDGTRVVFERKVAGPEGNGRLYVAHADGTGLVAITSTPQDKLASYAFSPDGSEVLFMVGSDASSELWIAKTDGSGARRLDVGMSVDSPAYRPPTGKEIVFAGDAGNGAGIGLFAVDVASDKVRTIVQPSPTMGIGWVRVAPDGSRAAYSASTQDDSRNTFRVQVSALDGSRTVTLPMPQGATFQDAPAWSNDSTMLVVTRGYSTRNQQMTLAVVPADATSVGIETARGLTGCCDTVLAWAPDDRSILMSPEDINGTFTEQVLIDPDTGSTKAAPWSATGEAAWQRIAR